MMLIRVAADADVGATAEAVALLAAELRRAGVPTQPAPATPAPGSKAGTQAAVDALVVCATLTPVAVTALVKVVTAVLTRQSARKIILQHGEDRIELDAASAADQRAALAAWCAARSGRGAHTSSGDDTD